jgi:guanylate kinase
VAQVSERLRNAKREIAAANEPGLFDYVIVNDSLEKALAQLLSTIQ